MHHFSWKSMQHYIIVVWYITQSSHWWRTEHFHRKTGGGTHSLNHKLSSTYQKWGEKTCFDPQTWNYGITTWSGEMGLYPKPTRPTFGITPCNSEIRSAKANLLGFKEILREATYSGNSFRLITVETGYFFQCDVYCQCAVGHFFCFSFFLFTHLFFFFLDVLLF